MTRYIVPGRVELVGKHVDYAGGRSLTCAVDRAITAVARPLREPVVRVRDAERRIPIEIPLDPSVVRSRSDPLWSAYVIAVARRFARDFPHARTGVEIELSSDLPPSAGLSSSSALVVAIASALADANEMEADLRWRAAVPDLLARGDYFGAMETGAPYGDFPGDEGVGVRGGAQDPVAILNAADWSVGQFSYVPARLERRIAWPRDHVLVIGVSGVRATKTGNARARYNRAADTTRMLVRLWNNVTGRSDATLADALASGDDAAAQLADIARRALTEFEPVELERRLAQFREEVEVIVPGVGDAFRDRDLPALGSHVDRSMALAETALGNQVPETLHLARSARELGAVAASAFGAGFGGSAWAMIPANAADEFQKRWKASYRAAFPKRSGSARFLVTRPGNPALRQGENDAS